MNIGLYFGTFNPIHAGHLIIANHMAEFSSLDQVWIVVTPHNPHKEKSSLLDNYKRLEMVHLAVEHYPKLRPSDIEFKLPQPNYTVNTLAYLHEKHPAYTFSLIMGEDNLRSLHKWKNYETLLENHKIYVYPRITQSAKSDLQNHSSITHIDAPIVEVSSTFIRECIAQGKNVRPLIPEAVWEFIDKNNLYRRKF